MDREGRRVARSESSHVGLGNSTADLEREVTGGRVGWKPCLRRSSLPSFPADVDPSNSLSQAVYSTSIRSAMLVALAKPFLRPTFATSQASQSLFFHTRHGQTQQHTLHPINRAMTRASYGRPSLGLP